MEVPNSSPDKPRIGTSHGTQPGNRSKSPSRSPRMSRITYKDQEVQTEAADNVVNDDRDIASVSKEVAEAHRQMVSSLRSELTQLSGEINTLKRSNMQLETQALRKDDVIESLTIEKEAMTEEIEALKEQIEGHLVQIETLELDIEDLNEEREGVRAQFAVDLDEGQQNIHEILEQNRVLRETMETLRKTVVREIAEKNGMILELANTIKKIPSLEKHIAAMEKEVAFKQQIEAELAEFKREIDLRSDSDRMIEVLQTKNVELEYEVKRLLEIQRHSERMEAVHAEMDRENEQFIIDLNEELNRKETRLLSNQKETAKLKKELQHAQSTVFQFKDHVRKLEDTKRRMSLRENSLTSTKKEQQLEKEMLLRSNLELLDRLDYLKGELIHYSAIAAKGFSHSVENVLLKQHIPKQVKCDYGALHFLGFLQRISFKVRFCKEVLDAFYIAAESTVGGDIGTSQTITDDVRDSDVKDTYKVLELCPILVKHDRFIECIQRGLCASSVVTFNEAVCCLDFVFYTVFRLSFEWMSPSDLMTGESMGSAVGC